MTDNNQDDADPNEMGTFGRILRGCLMFAAGLFVFGLLVFSVCTLMVF